MTSVTAVSRSVFSSKRGSKHLDDYGAGQGRPRHGLSDLSPEDKIAVQDVSLHHMTNSLEGDSMKYPVDSRVSTKLDRGASGPEYAKGLPRKEQFTTFDSKASRPGAAKVRPYDGSNEKIPVMNAGSIAWNTNVFELDVPSDRSRQPAYSSDLILRDEEDLGPTSHFVAQRSRKQSFDRPRTPVTNANAAQIRKGSIPYMNDSPGKEVYRPKRLSGFSIKRGVGALAQGSDAPEVVHQATGPRKDSDGNGILRDARLRPPQNHRLQPIGRPEFDTRSPLDNMVQYTAQFTGGRQLRSMQSTPALAHPSPPPITPPIPQPWMSRRPSAGSLNNMANRNKPLPPEPPGVEVIGSSRQANKATGPVPPTPGRKPNNFQPSNFQPSSFQPGNLQPSQPSSPSRAQFLNKDLRSRTAPTGQLPLVSRYAKPDEYDAAPGGPRPAPRPPPPREVEMVFRDLDTVRERASPRVSGHYDAITGPVQVRRGTGAMVPTRPAPPTPKRGISPVREARRDVPVPSTPARPPRPQQRIDTNVSNVSNVSNFTKPPAASGAVAPTPALIPPPAPESRALESRGVDSPTVRRGGGRNKLQQIFGEEPELQGERGRTPRPQADLNRDVFNEPSVPLMLDTNVPPVGGIAAAGGGGVSSPASAFRSGTSDAQFDEIRRRLDLLSPSSASETSFLSGQAFAQMLSNQPTTSAENPPISSNADGPMQGFTSALPEKRVQNSTLARAKSMSPVELPADFGWAGATQTFEMDASEWIQVSINPATPLPPPIPTSPKKARRSEGLKRHSTLSSGTGRTKSLRSVKSARSARSAQARSVNSLAISEIQELYAGLPSPRTTLASRRPSITADESIPELPPMPEIMPEVMTTEELEEKDNISADVAEQVLYQILRNLHEPEDLFNASLVSRGFQRTFRHHDTKLLRHALWYTSGPAWEYLEMHMPISNVSGQLEYPPDLYREQYVRDMRTMATLKSLILRYCGSILSRATTVLLCATSTSESAPVDDAIWRIWTFCKIFGEDIDRREDLEMQKRWIRGQTMAEAQVQGGHRGKYSIREYPAFAFGNDEGLTPEELIRMGEIWLCLRKLVRGYNGQRAEARDYGIFEGVDVVRNDIIREEAILDEWTIHLLSLAPGTNTKVLAPVKATADNFIEAEELGYTSWTPPGRNFTSSGFLTGPVCGVLEEWLATEPVPGMQPLLRPSALSANTDKTTGAPSRRTVEGFVSHIRTSQDGREFRKLLNGARPEPSVNIGQAAAQSLLSDTNIDVGDAGNTVALAQPKAVKESKEQKKSKFSLRLPSRSQTLVAKTRSKALAPMSRTANTSPNPDDGLASPTWPPTAGASSASRFDLIRNFTQRTRKNSAVNQERPTNLLAGPAIAQDGRTSPGDAMASSMDVEAAFGLNEHMPIRLAAERLRNGGYEPEVIDRILIESSKDNRVNYHKVLKKIKKTRVMRDRMERLERMGLERML